MSKDTLNNEGLNAAQKAKIVYEALDAKKASDIKIIDIRGITPVADYFVIASTSNDNQLNACLEEVERVLSEEGIKTPKPEGRRGSGWILLDCSDVIVHIFLTEDREFYNIERIWADGKDISLDNLTKS